MAEGNTCIASLVQLVVKSLYSYLQNRVVLSLGEEREFEKIKSSLYTIQSVIGSAEECRPKDDALVDWLEKLKDAAYDLYDVLDEYTTEDLRRKVEALNSSSVRDPVTNKVRKIDSALSIDPVLNHKMMTKKLKGIRKRLESIEEQRNKFQLSERVQKWENEFKEHRQTHSFVLESEVYGRDEDKEKIVNLLLCAVAGHEDENVSVIPIVGIGGLGKTTLAQLVFNDDRVQKHFELKMWVCVSADFDVRRLMKKIIDRATRSNIYDVSDLEELQLRVREALNERRFLLVLDDVWNEELEKWKRLRDLLMCGARGRGRGSRIVVTTRNPKIASIMSRIEPHQLKALSKDDCWKLFATRAFPDHREMDHQNLVKIGKDIVSKCKGVPLAVITLGSLLFDKKEESEWEFVRDSELWNLAAEDVYGILPALRLSYYHLNPHLRQCFVFCAIFPKDYEMDEEFLIQLWMAHGCVPYQSGKELEDIGIGILNELLTRSLFQKVKIHRSLKIMVHDLVHDLAQSVMGDDCCVVKPDKSINISKRVRHLNFHCHESLTPPDNLYEAQSLRTLCMVQFSDSGSLVPLDMAIFKSLRVLDLKLIKKSVPMEQLMPLSSPLPTSLGTWWMHLRYMRLQNVEIETLPESISSLLNLQTLILRDNSRLKELPKGTRNLINLRCLDIDSCDSLRHMPTEIGKLSCLRKLPLFVVGDSKSVCSGIEELQCINNLRGNLMIKHLQRIAIPSNAQRANLIGKPNIDGLQLIWDFLDNDDCNNTLKIEAGEEVLKGLQPHQNLKELAIIGYGGLHFPSWMICSLLPSIVKITLQDCRRCELPPLGQLPSLKFLHIWRMGRVENIGCEFYGYDMSEGFPSLETLMIEDMSSLKEWSGLHGERVFPKLVTLTILKCPMLTTIPCFPYLTSLQTLSIEHCHKLANLPDELQYLINLQILKIISCTDLTSLPEGIGNLSSLKELKLENLGLTSVPESMVEISTLRQLRIVICPQLLSLPKEINNLSSLETLYLSQLESLTSLPESMQELSTLTEVNIWSCPQLPSLPRGIGNLSSLQVLVLVNLKSLTSLPESMQELSTLKELRIEGCPVPSLHRGIGYLSSLEILRLNEFESLTSLPESMQQLSTLGKLEISGCPQLQSLPNGIGNLSSLQSLILTGLTSLTSLPESMQELSTLIRLCIMGCPQLPSLPEWVGNLTSLQFLQISDFPRMVSLPVGLQRLTRLRLLAIRCCPELQRRCKETGQDFQKIRHIPVVILDDHAGLYSII